MRRGFPDAVKRGFLQSEFGQCVYSEKVPVNAAHESTQQSYQSGTTCERMATRCSITHSELRSILWLNAYTMNLYAVRGILDTILSLNARMLSRSCSIRK